MIIEFQIQTEPKPAHPEFVERILNKGEALVPMVGDSVEYLEKEYRVKNVLWRDIDCTRVLIILEP
jgi:hypothetical protein